MRFRDIAVITLVLIGIVVVANGVFGKFDTDEIRISVKEKTVKRDGGEDRYLVFTENNGVLQCTDSLIDFKFDSSDLYGRLKIGEEYSVTTRGWRIPFFGRYPNIIKIN